MDGVPALGSFYSRNDILDVVDALPRSGVDGDRAELDELDGVEGLEEGCVGENYFADAVW